MCMAFHFKHLTSRTQANLLSGRAGDDIQGAKTGIKLGKFQIKNSLKFNSKCKEQ